MTPGNFLFAIWEGTCITIVIRSIIDMWYFRKARKLLRSLKEENLTMCKLCLLIKALQDSEKVDFAVLIPWKDLPNKTLFTKIKEILAKSNDKDKLLCNC